MEEGKKRKRKKGKGKGKGKRKETEPNRQNSENQYRFSQLALNNTIFCQQKKDHPITMASEEEPQVSGKGVVRYRIQLPKGGWIGKQKKKIGRRKWILYASFHS